MNIVAMHNMIRTLLDEHRTVRWDGPEIDDAINFVSKRLISSSVSPDGDVTQKFESVRKIRNELYPFLVTASPIGWLNGSLIPISAFPEAMRQLVRLSATILSSPAIVRAGVVVSVTDKTITVTDAAVSSLDVGRYMKVRDAYYKIEAVNASTPSITLKYAPPATVIADDAYVIYSGTELYVGEVNYITRNEYDSVIHNDPFSQPRISKLPRRIYYYLDSEGVKLKIGDDTALFVEAFIDYIKVPATVVYGTEYGINTSAGTSLPASELDYISVTESSISSTIYQENEEFTRNGGAIAYGVVVTGYVDSDFPESMHEEIIQKAAELLNNVPDVNTRRENFNK